MNRRLHFYTKAEIAGHINKQRTSGLSVDRYCEQAGLASSTFWNWRKRHASAATSAPPAFARLGIAPLIPAAQGFEVVFDNKVTVRIPAHFAAESLRVLISALR
jgi:hypothetical protein